MFKTQYFWKLWDAANVITGFASVQALAFAFMFISVAPEAMKQKIDDPPRLICMCIVIVLGGIIYSLGVSKCMKLAKSLLLSGEKMEINKDDVDIIIKSLAYSAKGRIIAIWFFTMLDIFVLMVASPCVAI
jgi:hypothetical protein